MRKLRRLRRVTEQTRAWAAYLHQMDRGAELHTNRYDGSPVDMVWCGYRWVPRHAERSGLWKRL